VCVGGGVAQRLPVAARDQDSGVWWVLEEEREWRRGKREEGKERERCNPEPFHPETPPS
jgi:hypothetical protein